MKDTPFSEIYYKVREDNEPERYALTRLAHQIPDNAYQRNHEAQQFIKRSNSKWGAQ